MIRRVRTAVARLALTASLLAAGCPAVAVYDAGEEDDAVEAGGSRDPSPFAGEGVPQCGPSHPCGTFATSSCPPTTPRSGDLCDTDVVCVYCAATDPNALFIARCASPTGWAVEQTSCDVPGGPRDAG